MQRGEERTRLQSIPSLEEVYSSENLPLIIKADALPSGERRVLEQMAIADLPARIKVAQDAHLSTQKTTCPQRNLA